MKLRKYTAVMDNGHDYFSVEYQSEHRNGSKANKADLMQTIRHTKSKSQHNAKIVSTELNNSY